MSERSSTSEAALRDRALPEGGPLRAAVARLEEFLLEPRASGAAVAGTGSLGGSRPVVAVVATAPGCGSTTVARAVGAELAALDGAGVAAVAGRFGAVPPLGSPAARRLARRVEAVAGGRTRAAGRLCLCHEADRVALVAGIRPRAPVVLEVPYGSAPIEAIALADTVVVVSAPPAEPALAAVVAATLARAGPLPLVVCNRSSDPDPPGAWHAVLPESRAAARAALAGCPAPGAFGRAIAELAGRIG